MENLVALIAALFESLRNRDRSSSGPPRRSGAAAAQLREALSARAPIPAASGPAPAATPQAAAVNPRARAVAEPTPGSMAAEAAPLRPPAVGSAAREAGLVTGLFANPQSLVAAFVVAEALAPPVALRER